MDHLAILERICEVVSENLEVGTPRYMYSAAICERWSQGSELEKDLVSRLAQFFVCELEWYMQHDYSNTKHAHDRLERQEYSKKWIEGRRKMYFDHKGLLAALDAIEKDEPGEKIEESSGTPSLL